MAVGKIPSNGVTSSHTPSEGPKKASSPEAAVPNNVSVAKRVPHPAAQILTAAMNQHKFEVETGKGLANLVLRIPIKNQSKEIGLVAQEVFAAPTETTSKKKTPYYSRDPVSAGRTNAFAMKKIA